MCTPQIYELLEEKEEDRVDIGQLHALLHKFGRMRNLLFLRSSFTQTIRTLVDQGAFFANRAFELGSSLSEIQVQALEQQHGPHRLTVLCETRRRHDFATLSTVLTSSEFAKDEQERNMSIRYVEEGVEVFKKACEMQQVSLGMVIDVDEGVFGVKGRCALHMALSALVDKVQKLEGEAASSMGRSKTSKMIQQAAEGRAERLADFFRKDNAVHHPWHRRKRIFMHEFAALYLLILVIRLPERAKDSLSAAIKMYYKKLHWDENDAAKSELQRQFRPATLGHERRDDLPGLLKGGLFVLILRVELVGDGVVDHGQSHEIHHH